MKKITFALAFCLVTLGVSAQVYDQPTEEMLRQYRLTIQKRDISKRYLESNIPLGEMSLTKSVSTKSLPEDRVWFPGEWEEVKAIVVTPYYYYVPATNMGSGQWFADPLVTGWAQYYKNSYNNPQGMGPYKAIIDTVSSFGNVSFYLMDGIQLGGAQAWVKVEHWADSNIVLRKLDRMGLRHDNIKFFHGKGNSFWYRDCGPICFYHGDQDSLAMLDFTYYPGRALDDSLPTVISQQYNIPNYISRIKWEGGNCLVDGTGVLFSSDAVYNNNNDQYGQITWDGQNINSLTYEHVTPLSSAQTKEALHKLLGQRSTHIMPQYNHDGGTGHIDLYADMWDENGFVFSVMPTNYSSWQDYQTGAKNIDSLCSWESFFNRKYWKSDIPFPKKNDGSNFSSESEYENYTRSYSNHTFVNNVILQPCFSNVVDGEPSAAWDKANIEQIKVAYPGYTIYPVDVREFDGTGGAIHCITKQIPADNPVRILHKNIYGNANAMQGKTMPVSAIITNRSGIANAIVNYRINDGAWQTLNLTANGNRFYGKLPLQTINPGTTVDSTVTVEYYISATSNNGKTITKPMTANQGGYYSFFYTNMSETAATLDSSMYDFDTTDINIEDITFEFSEDWTKIDNTPTIGIENISNEENFGQFYPNPATDKASINIGINNGTSYNVSIIDITGRTIHNSRLDAAGSIVFNIDASRLATGNYMVVFQNGDERITRKLIVK